MSEDSNETGSPSSDGSAKRPRGRFEFTTRRAMLGAAVTALGLAAVKEGARHLADDKKIRGELSRAQYTEHEWRRSNYQKVIADAIADAMLAEVTKAETHPNHDQHEVFTIRSDTSLTMGMVESTIKDGPDIFDKFARYAAVLKYPVKNKIPKTPQSPDGIGLNYDRLFLEEEIEKNFALRDDSRMITKDRKGFEALMEEKTHKIVDELNALIKAEQSRATAGTFPAPGGGGGRGR